MALSKTFAAATFGVSAAPGIYFATQISSEQEDSIIKALAKSKIVTIKTSGEIANYTNKFGATYADYFLPTSGDSDKKSWEARINKIISEKSTLKTDGFFKDLLNKDTINEQELKDKCKEAYGTEETSGNTEDQKWGEVWNYCSPVGVKPTLLKDLSGGSSNSHTGNAYGKKEEQKLVYETQGMNKDFWDFQNQRFADDKPKGSNGDIRKWCEEGYKKTISDDIYNDTSIYKYCSLEGEKKVS